MISYSLTEKSELTDCQYLYIIDDGITVGKLIFENNYSSTNLDASFDGINVVDIVEQNEYYPCVVYLESIEIYKQYRGNGYANYLMKHFLNTIVGEKVCLLLCAPFNVEDKEYAKLILDDFYRKHGFTQIKNSNYYVKF